MKKRILSYTAMLAFAAMVASCGKQEQAPQVNPMAMAVPISTYTVSEQHVTGTDTYPATVVAVNEVELRAQTSGYITAIFIKDGQRVKKGQKLYEIDRSNAQAAYREAQASVRTARANLARVQKDLERYENLEKQNAIARQQVDYARTDVTTAQAQVAAAQAQLSSASTNLGFSTITAPFDGTIGISQVRIGSQVMQGQTLLNTISSNGPVSVDFVINEQEIPRFTRMQQGAQPDSLFTITLADGTKYPHTGKFNTLDRAVGTESGTITVRVNFPNPDRQLVAGMTVDMHVLNQDIGQQMVIPFKAVTEQLGEFFVFAIKGDSAVQQNVQLGTRFGENIVVREGLKPGESIAVDGIQRLRQGAKVQVGAPQAGGAPQPAAK